MAKTKLEYFLSKVAASDLLDFQKRLSELPQKRKKLLARLLGKLLEGETDNEKIYAQLYPGKTYSDKQSRNLRSELFADLIEYLAFQEYQRSGEQNYYLARSLNRYDIEKYFSSLIGKEIQNLETMPLGLDRADQAFRLEIESLHHRYSSDGRHMISLDQLVRNTEERFVGRIMKFSLGYLIEGRVKGQPRQHPPLQLWPSILKRLEQGEWKDSLLIQLYFRLYLLEVNPDDPAYFHQVKGLLSDEGKHLALEEAIDMYTAILNHCIRRNNLGDTQYLVEMMHFYQEMEERGVLTARGSISPYQFKSIVSTAVRLSNFDWVRKFMSKYENHLPASFRNEVVHFSFGLISFAASDYPTAESHMNQVLDDHSDPFIGLDARAYLLRIYYETGNMVGMDALVNSFRLFLDRYKKLHPQRIKNYKEYIRFVRRLLAINPGQEKRIQKLKDDIEQSPYYAGRQWLLEKLDVISNS